MIHAPSLKIYIVKEVLIEQILNIFKGTFIE